MRDLLTWYLPCFLWLCAAALSCREALAYRRARRQCEAMQDRAIAAQTRAEAALERHRAWLLGEDTHA